LVKLAICKCIPQLAKYFPEKAKAYFAAQFTTLRNDKTEKNLISASFACAGLLKSLGMSYINEIDLFNIVQQESFAGKKVENIRKQAGLYLYDAMSYSMGHSFEVYLPQVFPSILACISDNKEVVRSGATNALKTIMSKFSNFAIKQALPQFLT